MALPPYDFLTSAPTDQLGTSLGTDFDYLNAFRSGQGMRNDIDYSNQPMIQVMPPPFTIGDNPDVIKDMNLPDYMNFQKYMRERGAADLINPQNQVPIKDVGSDSTGIGEIILPPIAGGGGGGGGGVEGPINYNNLIVRDQSTGTGIDSKKTGILEGLKTKGNALLDFIKKGGVIGNIASGLLPEQDPRATALRDFYGDNFGLTSSGSVASGIMQNYNPVSGGFLNLISGGKYGDETQYGLGEAIDERMDNIKDMLGSKYGYSYTNDSQMYKDMIAGKIGKYGIKGHTSAAENYFKLKSLREKEKIALDIARKKQQEKIEEQEKIQNKIYQESQTKKDVDKIQEKIGSKTGSASPYQGGSGGLHSNYNSSSTKGTNTNASKSSKSSSSKGTNQGYSQHFREGGKVRRSYFDGGIVTL